MDKNGCACTELKSPEIVDFRLSRLIAAGAAMAANAPGRLKQAVAELRKAGAEEETIRLAVQVGQFVKEKPALIMKKTADDLTGSSLAGPDEAGACPAEGLKGRPEYALVLLIGAGAAMAANCEPCLNSVIPKLIEAGVAEKDIQRAVRIGQFVKDEPAAIMKEAADLLAGTDLAAE